MFKKILFVFLCFFSFSFKLIAEDKTSDQLIDEAVKAKRITNEIGFLYKIKMRFSPTEVPLEFQGKLAENRTHNLLMKIPSMLDEVSGPTQRELVGFMIPPIYEGSKLIPNQKSSFTKIINKDNDQPIPEPFPKADWVYVENSEIRVWWQKDSNDEDNAHEILSYFPEIKEKLESLTGKKILSDSGKHFYKDKDGNTKYWADGGNGKLDFYIAYLSDALALTVAYPGSCSESPSFIVIDRSLYGKRLKAALAHEFMHALSFTFTHGRTCKEYQDADEGIANWAINYVDPNNNFEQDFDSLIKYPGYGLPNQDYESWPFFLFMEKNFGAHSIIDIYENYHLLSNWEAVDQALPGGFKKQWPLFGAAQWNQIDEFDDFNDWDNWDIKPYWNRPRGNDTNYNPIEVKPDVKGNFYYEKEFDLRPLATDYFYFKFNDPTIRSITFELVPKYEFTQKLRTKVFVKRAGHVWEVEDWMNKEDSTENCQDIKDDTIEEIVFAVSNINYPKSGEDFKEGPLVQFGFNVQATNIACKKHIGNFESEIDWRKNDGSSYNMTVKSNAIFEAEGYNEVKHFIGRFWATEGGGNFNYHGTVKEGNAICEGSTSGNFKIVTKNRGNSLGMYPAQVTTPNSRLYTASLGSIEPASFPVTYICPGNMPPVHGNVSPLVLNTGAKKVADPDGILRGNYTQKNSEGHITFKWIIQPGQ